MKNRTNATRISVLWVASLSMAVLLTVLGGNVALAKSGNSTQIPTHNGEPVQSHNKSNKGLKTPHSARKQAAKRLQAHHQKEHQQKLQKWAESHHGYTGLGEAGESFNKNPKPAQNGEPK